MKYDKIILFFGLSVPVCALLRFVQLIFTVDYTTGFLVTEYKLYGTIIIACIIAFAALMAFFAFFSYISPEKPPKPNILLSLTAFAVSASVLYEVFTYAFSATAAVWQGTLLRLLGVATAIFFVLYGAGRFTKIELPPLFTVVPIVYFVFKVICDFTAISSLALISDNIMLIAAYCVILLFMLNFAKLYNNVHGDYGPRKLMASSLAAAVLCFTQSVPYFLVNVLNNFSYTHTSMATSINVFCTGLFITVFSFSYFAQKD